MTLEINNIRIFIGSSEKDIKARATVSVDDRLRISNILIKENERGLYAEWPPNVTFLILDDQRCTDEQILNCFHSEMIARADR